MRRLIAPMVVASLLCSCASTPHIAVQKPAPGGVALDSLPGWSTEHVADAMPALLRGCARLALAPPDQRLGGAGPTAVRAGDFTAACAAARAVPPRDEAAARIFFQHAFSVRALTDPAHADGLFTGYAEPEFSGSREKNRRFSTPVMTKPADLAEQTGPDGVRRFGRFDSEKLVPYFSRAEIDAGALRRQRLDLLYLQSPIDLFFLQLRGVGRIVLPHGQVVRLGYAAGNGQPYVPIGRALAEAGEIAPDAVSEKTIRDWLHDHPRQARAMMEQNPSYTFFREIPDLSPDAGPLGTLGVSLEPMRSIAVDRLQVPLGAPVWIDTLDIDGKPLERLMLAQDSVSATDAALRADIFFGWGPDAEQTAGRMQSHGRAWVLVPAP